MEVSVIGRSQTKLGRSDLAYKDVGFGSDLCPKICFRRTIRWPKSSSSSSSSVRFTLKAVAKSEAVVSDKVAGDPLTTRKLSKPNDGVRLYVGLPLDAVSGCNTINHARAIAAGLKALKLLGVDGVELPVWWGIAESEAMGKYEWSGYLALAEMVQKVGLKLHVSLCFHASQEPKIPLPKWVSRIGESQPDIFFADRSGQHYKECLSLAVDDLPVLDGKTPTQVYKDFCESFKSTFLPFMGSTITGISIGLGPDGELRYPSHHNPIRRYNVSGVGEFQCYDKNMLSQLKEQAQALGNPLWGLSGPHDVPSHDESPKWNNFFKEHGGSWETPYGDFFLSWYSSQLISHGDRILSLASSTFSDTPVTVAGKIPLIHSWYRTRSHASELTAGFHNTACKDGYEAIAQIFERNSCKMILPGMDLSDENEPNEALSSPELLLMQITTACKKQGVKISGQNSPGSGSSTGFEQIKKNMLGENAVVDLFTYQRMGANLFSPENFPSFTEFVRSLNQLQMHSDDLAEYEERADESPRLETGKNLQMQAA